VGALVLPPRWRIPRRIAFLLPPGDRLMACLLPSVAPI
jgi:hypothetical protein